MKTLEERVKERKKSKLITVGICYLFVIIYALQGMRAYLVLKTEQYKPNLNDILLLTNDNISNNFFFIPTNEYKPIFAIITAFFIVLALNSVMDVKKTMKGEEHGSAKWGNKTEKVRFKDKKNKDNNTFLSNEIAVSLNNRKTKRNANTLVVGGSGSGKTFQFMLPNILSMSGSYIINDVKGELLINTGRFLEDNGYKIRVLNIKDMSNTMHYNPFKYIENEDDILEFIKCLFDNTNGTAKEGEAFWKLAEQALDTAIIAFLKYNCRKEDQNLPNVLEMLRWCDVSEEDENSKSLLDMVFEELEEDLEDGEDAPLSLKQYKIYKKAAGKTAKSILISAMSRLAFLDLTNCKNMFTGEDEMEFEKIGQEKTALYIVNSDTSTTYNFILGMAYSQCLNILSRNIDKGLRNKFHIHLLMDEFSNGAKVPDFPTILSVVRSRNISCKIIIQSISQLKKMYKEGDEWESIVDNCDLKLFLGAGYSSCEWLSKQLGKMTIDSTVYNRSYGRSGSRSENNSRMGRELMTTDELMKLDNNLCICMIRGVNPMLSNKYNTLKNPRFKYLGDVDDPMNPKNYYFNKSKTA
ncbi:UNVERIFIED_ORG: hypothetical protein B2H98_08185 [Clostridium botulinum]